jgi:hypothetical protein
MPPIMSSLGNFVQSLNEIPQLLKKAETHCIDLARAFGMTSKQVPGFTVKDMHYEADGLVLLYHCEADGRTYKVKFTVEGE